MLNILQTGDLHLGKVLYEYSLIEDQRHVLNLLIQELGLFAYDALIIAGDVYDRSIPSPEAVRLFDDFLIELNEKFPSLAVCIISGNHDSPTRLSYASNFLKSKNIFISTNPNTCDEPIILSSQEGDKVALYQIPFLQTGSLQADDETLLKTQEELIAEAITRICTSHTKLQKTKEEYASIPLLVNCHLFTLQGLSSDSERLFLGNAELINPTVFSPFLYTAIGHLHKKQKVLQNAYYAGSPLSYSFSEIQTEKVFLRVELDTKKGSVFNVTSIPIIPLRNLVQIEARFDDFEKMTELKDDFIEFTCINEVPIENLAARLRKTFPYLLSVKQKAIISTYKNTEETLLKQRTLFEKKDVLPLNDIFYMFLQNLGIASDDNSPELQNEWSECAALFEKTAKEVGLEEHETQ